MELVFKIIEFRGDRVVLKSEEDNREILWPKNKLPSDIKEGDFFNFLISEKEQDEVLRGQRAKDILNEILSIE